MKFEEVKVGDKLVFINIGNTGKYGKPLRVVFKNSHYLKFEDNIIFYPEELHDFITLSEAMELHPEEFI